MSVLFPIFHDGTARLLEFAPNDATINPLAVSIDDLIKWIANKDPVAIGNWRELSSEEYVRSFSAAQTAGYGVVGDLYREFMATIETQGTEQDFASRVLPILRRKGWLKGTGENVARRVQLIYDTNLRLGRAAGQWQRYQRTSQTFPYLRGVTARDDRVRRPPRSDSDHNAFDGIILPASHAFWTRWFPPLGFRCRCSVIQMTRSQLARWNSDITTEAELAEREARLGIPVFASPVSFSGQLATIAGIANEKRIPGQPAFDLRAAQVGGSNVLRAALIENAADEIGDFLNRIFGRP
jgi:uncharacterized protein with gpF-like domain